jgi:hypothetical protein
VLRLLRPSDIKMAHPNRVRDRVKFWAALSMPLASETPGKPEISAEIEVSTPDRREQLWPPFGSSACLADAHFVHAPLITHVRNVPLFPINFWYNSAFRGGESGLVAGLDFKSCGVYRKVGSVGSIPIHLRHLCFQLITALPSAREIRFAFPLYPLRSRNAI